MLVCVVVREHWAMVWANILLSVNIPKKYIILFFPCIIIIFLCEKNCEFIGPNVMFQNMYVRNNMFSSFRGNVGMYMFCQKNWGTTQYTIFR